MSVRIKEDYTVTCSIRSILTTGSLGMHSNIKDGSARCMANKLPIMVHMEIAYADVDGIRGCASAVSSVAQFLLKSSYLFPGNGDMK